MSSNQKNLIFMLTIAALTGTLTACGGPSGGGQSSTIEALAQSVALTATAEAGGALSKDDALRTAEAKATQRAADAYATETAVAALGAEERAATATAFAPYLAELTNYGVDPEQGRPGWIHPPVTLDLEGYQQDDSANRFVLTLVRDFVISADITWNTQYGTSGCGFVLRSDGKEEEGNQYMVLASRSGTGHVLFNPIAEGEMAGGWDFYARGNDPDFNWQNDTTNRIAVVGRGTQFQIYTNGKLIGEVDVTEPPPEPMLPPTPVKPADTSDSAAMDEYRQEREQYDEEVAQIKAEFNRMRRDSKDKNIIFERGFVALLAISESGRTFCKFDNTWLWLIEE
jgi:hypothetical protein